MGPPREENPLRIPLPGDSPPAARPLETVPVRPTSPPESGIERPMPDAPSTEDVQLVPTLREPPAMPNRSNKPAFEPDELGRRPIADSSRPIMRDRDGVPIMPPESKPGDPVPPPAPPIPTVAQPIPSVAQSTMQPMPSSPPPADTLAPMPAPVPPVAARSAPPTPTDAGPPRPPATNQEGAPAAEAPPPGAPSGLLLEKVGPTTVNRGQPMNYELIVRNVTNAPLSHVHVEDDLPPGVQLVSAEPRPDVQHNKMVWNFPVLDPGAERRCKVQLMLSAVGEMNSCAVATFEVNACLRTTVTQPHLVLKKTGPETVSVGEKAVFQLDLTNDGNGPATGVVLCDSLPTGLEHPQGTTIEAEVGTLAPGETKHITLETRAVQPGRLVNRACATGHGLTVSAEAVVMVTAPALALRKNGPRTRFIGREAEFDIEIANPGTAPATNVQILDRIPQGLEFVSASDNGVYDPTTRSVLWNLPMLKPGQREGISLKLVGKTEGDFLNQAFARADRNLEARAEAPIRIDGVAALMLEVVDLDDPVEVGNETVYEIHVINQGTSPCSRLTIVATAPEGMVPRSGTGPSAARISGQQVIFEPVPLLAAHADATFRVRVLCRTAGDWRFRVQMRCDQLGSPVLEEESTRIYADQ
jgi:uncharacterized repeat protein (TIGR01451 family)